MVEITQNSAQCRGIKFSIHNENGDEVARAFLYIMYNDLHQRPFGFMEDVFVSEKERGGGLGTEIVKRLIKTAQEEKCYKLIATSRHSREKVHKLYERLGFYNQGKEFRIDFK